jgi:thiol:disulfide interchange protein DsbD
MKKILFFLPFIFFSLASQAQLLDPVDWKMEVKQVSADEHELIFTATIDPGWHLYSQFINEGGPIPTSFNFEGIDGYEVIGKTVEIEKPETEQSEVFGMELLYFSKKATFIQKVKRLKDGATAKGFLEFMACNDERCTPPMAEDFSFELKNTMTGDAGAGGETESETESNSETDGGEQEEEPEPEVEQADAAPAETETADTGQQQDSGILEPVTWDFAYEKVDEQTYKLNFTANIEKGWKVYSQHIADGGPIPTSFTFKEGAYELVGEVTESDNVVKKQDKVFGMELAYFKEKAVFSQEVRFSGAAESIGGELTFMTCDDGRCLPPAYVDFAFEIAGKLAAEEGGALASENNYTIETIDLDNPMLDCNLEEEESKKGKGLWGIFLLGLIGGFAALLTPCVFPMIPLTVSFFTKGSENKTKGLTNATLYGLSILAIYVALTIPFHLLDSAAENSNMLNLISTNPTLNVIFFLVFVAFGLSFFGYFDLTLPSGFVNKISSKSSGGGYFGIFFMAATLALVSFSCTGPILGGLLGSVLTKDSTAWDLTAGFAGFGVALGLPFALFAAFPSWLNSLPQSGGWMNTVKVVLGFVEMALAVKFLSIADMTANWGFLRYEIFLGSWVLIALALAAYLFGLIKFPHDPPKAKLSPTRLGFAAFSLALAVYFASGFMYSEKSKTYNSLSLLSGLAPPAIYNYFRPMPPVDPTIKAKYPSYSKCANNLDCFKDYYEGIAYAKEVGKPVMVDFTGYGCVNCRKMEEHVWIKQSIFERINEEYVLISLYVDDRKALKEIEEIIIPQTGKPKKLRTVGDRWATLETFTFNNNTQPLYVLISPEQKLLTYPKSYNYSKVEKNYRKFLDCGLEAYQKAQDGEISLR